MQLQTFVVAIVVFSVFMVGSALVYDEMKDDMESQTGINYHTNVTNISSAYNQIDRMQNTSQNVTDTIFGIKNTQDDAVSSTIRGSYGALRLLASAFPITNSIVDQIMIDLKIDSKWFFIKTAFLTIVLIILGFALISTILRTRVGG